LDTKTARVSFKQKNEFISDSKSTNVYIAAFTTANARLRLYNALDILKDKVLYMSI